MIKTRQIQKRTFYKIPPLSNSRADKTKLGKQKPDKRLLFMREVLTRKRHEEASQGAVHVLYLDLGVVAAAAAAKSLQSCLTLCDPIDGSPPGSPVPVIFQARTLEWVAISFSNA